MFVQLFLGPNGNHSDLCTATEWLRGGGGLFQLVAPALKTNL